MMGFKGFDGFGENWFWAIVLIIILFWAFLEVEEIEQKDFV
jgi:hypothetical protein